MDHHRPSDAPITSPERAPTGFDVKAINSSNKALILAHLPRLALTLFMDVVLPVILYFVLRQPTGPLAAVWALLIAGCPALVMVIIKGIWRFSLDIIGLLVFVAFAVSAIVAVATGNARILVMEKSLVTAVLGVLFLISLVPFHWRWKGQRHIMRPVAYNLYIELLPMSKTQDAAEKELVSEEETKTAHHIEAAPNLPVSSSVSPMPSADAKPVNPHSQWAWLLPDWSKKHNKRKSDDSGYDFLYRHSYYFRRSCRIITLIWAIGFLLEFILRLILALTLPNVDQIVGYANVVFGILIGLSAVLTIPAVIMGRKKTTEEIVQYLEERKAGRTNSFPAE